MPGLLVVNLTAEFNTAPEWVTQKGYAYVLLSYDLFNDAVGNSGYTASNCRMFRE